MDEELKNEEVKEEEEKGRSSRIRSRGIESPPPLVVPAPEPCPAADHRS